MRLHACPTLLHVSIFAALVLALGADGEDPDCQVEVNVRRHTVYEADRGDDLTIDCPVRFCNNSPPTVTWFKREKTDVRVNVSSDSHIKTEWTQSDSFKGISHLIFRNILSSDSGLYQCRSNADVGHRINVSVSDRDVGLDDGADTNITEENHSDSRLDDGSRDPPVDAHFLRTLWPYVYRMTAIFVFAILVTIICVMSQSGCKGVCCEEKSGDPSRQPSRHETHIYENDQQAPYMCFEM